MGDAFREMVAFQWGAFFGFASGMAGMGFMWWMSGRGRR